MPLSLLNHPALALFAQRTRIPTSARSIGFCVIWVCISSSSSLMNFCPKHWALFHLGLYQFEFELHGLLHATRFRSGIHELCYASAELQIAFTSSREHLHQTGNLVHCGE